MAAGNPSVGVRFEGSAKGVGLRPKAADGMLGPMSTLGGAQVAPRQPLLVVASRAAALALIAFHVWLLWAHILTGRLLDPAVATRWVVGAGLFAGLVGLKRLGVPVLFGRNAAVIWTLVAVLHCHAAITTPAAGAHPSGPSAAVLVVPVTLGSAAFGLGLLLWLAVRQRPVVRPRPSAWFVGPMATAGVATALHVLTLAPRPPPNH